MKSTLLAAVVAALVAGGIVWTLKPTNSSGIAAPVKESAYERVMRTGVLRCGYLKLPPYINIDPNTGEFSGIFYDYTEKLAASLSLEVEWVEEMGFGEFPTGLDLNRVDAYCSLSWISPQRARLVDYVAPVVHESIHLVARIDDMRFEQNLARANQPDIRFSALEGSVQVGFIQSSFPAAEMIELPQVSSIPQTLVEVEVGKADVAIVSGPAFTDYEKNNPGKLKIVDVPPFRTAAVGMAVKGNEYRLKNMLSAASRALLETGDIDKIVQSYGYGDTILVTEPSYRLPNATVE